MGAVPRPGTKVPGQVDFHFNMGVAPYYHGGCSDAAYMVILAFFFLLCSTSYVPAQSYSTFYVTKFGAVGDGKTDDSQKCPGIPPAALHFDACNGLQLSGLSLHDNPRNHISVNKCNSAVLSNLTIRAPGDSPNTDGIDISNLNNIQIHNCIISTGDDCIAINNGTSNVNISYITCGPGHGISIGSLGGGRTYAAVQDIHVSHSNFTETKWAARIKTWKGGSGYVRGVSYKDIILNNVQRAITINQEYDDGIYERSVVVSNVSFIGFHGTASRSDAISMKCGPGPQRCTDVVLGDVNISSSVGQKLEAFCQFAHGPRCTNCIPPDCVETSP
ncbi:putative polygalacturonase [Cinnamomum micranthum f. kanehirae]|uniref:Putative polygalacturonase n=1 Tax=Cinnamomum micranthum f. kanehirae TaxID=337451 RepID=A0A3S3QCC3_9MAGN|nr:putative polygalacturonase [Cinnamomum micranthum f. kanehirae]